MGIDSEKTCWKSKTPYQIAYILILSVAVPCLIAFIICYITFLTVWNKSEECSKLCSLRPDRQLQARLSDTFYDTEVEPEDQGPDVTIIDLNDYDYWVKFYEQMDTKARKKARKKTRSVDDKKVDENRHERVVVKSNASSSAAVAVLQQLYEDNGQDKVFACPGVTTSNTVVLASYQCMENFIHDLALLEVRARSAHWSMGGVVAKVANVAFQDNLTAILLEGDLGESVNVTVPEAVKYPLTAIALVWTVDTQLPLVQRRKFNGISKTEVTLYLVGNHLLGRGTFNTTCTTGSPLLNHNQTQLYGFITECQEDTFRVLDILEYREWLV